jgi:hypothetical protein
MIKIRILLILVISAIIFSMSSCNAVIMKKEKLYYDNLVNKKEENHGKRNT